jgi:hypothetical protein
MPQMGLLRNKFCDYYLPLYITSLKNRWQMGSICLSISIENKCRGVSHTERIGRHLGVDLARHTDKDLSPASFTGLSEG